MSGDSEPRGQSTPGQPDQTPPCWLRIWATDVMPNDLIRFRPGTDAVRIIDRTYPSAISPSFTLTLPGGETTGVMKMAKIEVFDPDGSVRRRVQMVLPPLPDPHTDRYDDRLCHRAQTLCSPWDRNPGGTASTSSERR